MQDSPLQGTDYPSASAGGDVDPGFDDSSDVAREAIQTFEPLEENIFIGHATSRAAAEEAMPCQCKFDPTTDHPRCACGDKSSCINRTLFIECQRNDCPTGRHCQNQRFQKKQYANVRIIKTRLKGFGLVAAEDLGRDEFVMEYIGEVIRRSQFAKRTQVYEQENIEHHYFMSIRNDEVIDATRKGCIARFVNHSCAPNCEVQKWVVGSRFRMGIFTTKPVPKGTELTFDYKFVRYGAAPQRCFCGEPTCKGFIGVMKDPQSLGMAPGDIDLDEEMESQEVSARQKAKAHEDDGDYVDTGAGHAAYPSRGLNSSEDVIKFIKVMIGAAGKPNLALKLLSKLQDTTETSYLRKFIRMHGVPLLKSMLMEYGQDPQICTEVLKVFVMLPITKRNTVDDHRLAEELEKLKLSDDTTVVGLSEDLLRQWQGLELVYRIPKVKPTPASASHSATQSPEPSTLYRSPKRKRDDFGSAWDVHSPRASEKRPAATPTSRSVWDAGPVESASTDGNAEGWGQSPMDRAEGRASNGWRGEPSAIASTYQTSLERTRSDPMRSSGAYRPRTAGYHSSSRTRGAYDRDSSQSQYRSGSSWRPESPSEGRSHGEAGDSYRRSPRSDSHNSSPVDAHRSRRSTSRGPSGQWSRSSHRGATGSTSSTVLSPRGAVGKESLPPNWRATTAPNGQTYYYHIQTGETQWEKPASEVTVDGVSRAQLDEVIRKASLRHQQQATPTTGGDGTSTATGNNDSTSASQRSKGRGTFTPTGGNPSRLSTSTSTPTSATKSETSPTTARSKSLQQHTAQELQAKDAMANVVIRCFSRYKSQLDRDTFKREARKITRILLEKEYRAPGFTFAKLLDMPSTKRVKVKQFVDEYAQKLLRQHRPAQS
ncbi:hypothetical protein H4R34_003605 [Dimargaris verticillata]|uniref:[histone H3]-lysine(36) N-trimethyltransferase n=1 Tax=Dimargaris verticillata TaxID=2761393 RepID=A0A9W8ECG5_9FUNG|nr:hypothetical protein H4R34_003605 [Dimargaris verticillata]